MPEFLQVLQHKAHFETFAIAGHAFCGKVVIGKGLFCRSGSGQSRGNSKIHSLKEEASSKDKAGCISHNHHTCPRQLRQHGPTTFGDHVCRVFQHHAIPHKRCNGRMLLELIEQFIRPYFLSGKRGDLDNNTDRERIAIRIKKPTTFDITRSIANIFIGHALIAIQIEALLNRMCVKTQHLFDPKCHFIRPKFALQPCFLSEKRIRPISRDYDWCIQVAVLAPTTVLAFQHYESFRRRFAAFPVRIEMLSRFRTAKEIKQVLAETAEGKNDILIGTHRILSQDIEFRDLGLLIVDEEQRFGVRHKERLKQIKRNVDVLTMSATPIPRTLHMSLLGIRDMSVIETPPKDRLAIHTVVAHFDPELIRTAIDQELSRGGQVYFIHNRVDTIFQRAAMIKELLPQCRIGVGHGQMPEAELEKVLLGFMRHEYDVFVSTTIVENGLDIPLANTMLIENAERYGLSELYQLRGRVGRSNRRAYAYLLVPTGTELSEVARKRLAALKEFSDLGAGFKIAALDLELRGAGNILGGEQHGHIAAVGFDMYVRLLEETVHELKGEEVPVEVHATLNLGLDIRIPVEYVADEHQRLRTYKKIADVSTAEDAERILSELADRYGPPPEAVITLLKFSTLKSRAQRLGIEAIDRRHGALNVKFHKDSRIDPNRLMELISSIEGAQFTPAGVLRLPLNGLSSPSQILDFAGERLSQLS